MDSLFSLANKLKSKKSIDLKKLKNDLKSTNKIDSFEIKIKNIEKITNCLLKINNEILVSNIFIDKEIIIGSILVLEHCLCDIYY